jgi:hypothetical protein
MISDGTSGSNRSANPRPWAMRRAYQRSLPLATGRLRIVGSQLGDEAGIIGAAVMVIESLLQPASIDAALAGTGR